MACRRSRRPGSPTRKGCRPPTGRWARRGACALALLGACLLPACGPEGAAGYEGKSLLLALSVFESGPGGVKAGPARLVALSQSKRGWRFRSVDDPDSNVFHKAMVYDPGNGRGPAILTLGGSRGILKLWRKSGGAFSAETLWEKDFGGKFSRMRDIELGDVDGDGTRTIVVATHDQGVVAVVRPKAGSYAVEELDVSYSTLIHIGTTSPAIVSSNGNTNQKYMLTTGKGPASNRRRRIFSRES